MTVWNDLLIFSEYVPLGTFWSLDWDSPDDTLEATVTARDRMELLRKGTYQTSQVQTDKSLYELAEGVLPTTTTTIDSPDNNAFYEVIYEYPPELSTIPGIAVTYSNNFKAQVDNNTKVGQVNNKLINDLNDFAVAYMLNLEMRLLAQEARKAETQAESMATNTAELVTDFNALIAKLKAANLMS
jgi:hypothetical protein